ncbi:MAG: hypothetical protein LBH87_00820, partial [Coriobacteriales bacterium]|nr:hypothetical protein [Coriobacteriales bacterium]
SASASASASAPPIHPAAILYDGRASDTALIWTELDLSDQGWQVYAASLKGATLGTPQLLDQGSSDYEVPLICVSGSKAYWSVMPNAGGAAQYENSYLKAAVLGEFDAEQAAGHETTAPQTTPADTVTAALQRPPYVVYTSHGRMIAQPLATQGILSFVPRVDTNGIYYRLTALSVADDSLIASVILPQSLRVSEALYLDNSFTFSIEANYSSAGGLGQFGTYRQMDNGQWLHFGRVPTSPAMRVNEFLVLKSTLSVVGLDVANQSYCIIPPPSDTEDFGDTLAGWGESDHIVVFAQTKASSASIASATIVRVFARSASNSS